MLLYNRISHKKLKKIYISQNNKRIIVSFYKYCHINNPDIIRNNIYILFYSFDVLGRIYIATEGINAQISIPYYFYRIVKLLLGKIYDKFQDLYWNIAIQNNQHAFFLLKVQYKNKILNDGLLNFNFLKFNKTGIYLNAQQTNLMIENNNTVLIDMRNYYEYIVGHFDNAIIFNNTLNFRQQMLMLLDNIKPYKNKNIILYCTGGIRCEKATSWLLFNNIKNVFHIKGGIIKYIKDVYKYKLPLKFKGTNFVFDYRMGEQITEHIISYCYQCKNPYNFYTNCKNDLCHLLFLQCPTCQKKYSNCCSINCKNIFLNIKK
ncbi:rhodanese-related sulfurtransferase [Enterobacteriaceae endosymbiont of Neohaemonia nigricornis]|uniref:oxygen-dependent tRNA uridine(34) hydroxylase TrhO n=1 Tax=Enterobacteriaceae endosymbiont of Neohaemonia nigricornis TaxID=2675792 RepID=UPI001449D3B6|nr:rhodanese-related sulfurtransferase [Enterobacteriaceae endosymbiont of Neohaemonia nigricornis]QJC30354.1 rhodanese-related sulfurtransferase [Enterobacteriaceae endosymbiont of Neohaemonia nigricornis]